MAACGSLGLWWRMVGVACRGVDSSSVVAWRLSSTGRYARVHVERGPSVLPSNLQLSISSLLALAWCFVLCGVLLCMRWEPVSQWFPVCVITEVQQLLLT